MRFIAALPTLDLRNGYSDSTATAGWAGGAPPDPLYTLIARLEAAMCEQHIRLVRRAPLPAPPLTDDDLHCRV